MAKGKHAPAPGQVREDKILQPNSRKVLKLAKKETRRGNVAVKGKLGVARLSSLADKLAWVKEALPLVLTEEGGVTKEGVRQLVRGMLERFDEELRLIKLKNSIGGKNKRKQHNAREDAISHAIKDEREEYEGCGIELPDLFDSENLAYFLKWDGEVRLVQNIKMRRFRRQDLETEEGMET